MGQVLITGASGFLGSHLAKFLSTKYDVISFFRNRSSIEISEEVFVWNGSNEELESLFETNEIDGIIHTAASYCFQPSLDKIDNLVQANLSLPTKLLYLAKKYSKNCFFINCSSFSQFIGNEESASNLYTFSKISVENLLQFAAKFDGIATMSLVLYDMYGKGDSRNKILNQLISKEKMKACLNMTEGEQYVHFVNIADVLEAFSIAISLLQVASKPNYRRYFLNSDKPIQLRQAVETISYYCKHEIRINWGALSYPEWIVMNPFVGERLPGWTPKVSFEQGIKEMING